MSLDKNTLSATSSSAEKKITFTFVSFTVYTKLACMDLDYGSRGAVVKAWAGTSSFYELEIFNNVRSTFRFIVKLEAARLETKYTNPLCFK